MAFGILAAVLGAASLAATAEGAEPVAQVLNVAVPRRFVDPQSRALTPGELVGRLQKDLGQIVCPGPLCTGNRGPQVQLAVGNDYEILDWLGKGLVDVGVIPTLSRDLLRADQIDLLEVGGPSTLPSVSSPRSFHLASRSWRSAADSRRDFEAAQDYIWCRAVTASAERRQGSVDAGERQRCRGRLASADGPYELVMPSHLSTYGFLVPVTETAKWLGMRPSLAGGVGPSTPDQRPLIEEFWQEFFASTRFTLGGPEPARDTKAAPATRILFMESPTPRVPDLKSSAGSRASLAAFGPDHVMIRRTAKVFLQAILNQRAEPGRRPPHDSILEKFPGIFGVDSPRAFRAMRLAEPAFGVRTFAFTVDETLELLRQHHDDIEELRLALVLPGGGVKAAYQTRLLEHLYSNGHLRNFLTARDPIRRALPVNYVIGTSGGALLGFFVARLNESGPWQLSEVLWRNCSDGRCRPLQTTDIFNFVDMPRYLSLLAIAIVFWLLLSIRNWISERMRPAAQAMRPTRRMWRLRLILVMGPILVLTPILIRYVNGPIAREHIPVIEGFFYAGFAFLLMFVDQCVIRDDAQVHMIGPVWRRLGIGLSAAGGLAVILCLLAKWGGRPRWLSQVDSSLAIQHNSLVVCIGAALLLVGATLWTYTSMPHYVLADVSGFLAGLSLVLGVIGAVYLILGAVVFFLPSWLSFLELTTQFWYWLLATSVVVGVATLGLDWIGRRVPTRWLSPIVSGAKYLSADHPNGDLVIPRYVRLLVAALTAVVWWNFVVAPGLYGNGPAQTFMKIVVGQFDGAYKEVNKGSSTRLTSSLIVPANDLDRNQTVYFLFAPGIGDCPSVVKRPGDDAIWERYLVPLDPYANEGNSDRRIVSCDDERELPRDLFRKVVFASGSPFPVFPAHQVQERLLVDGGYSNLVPVDAALSVSAEAVLIIESSSPLSAKSAPDAWWWKVPGELISRSPGIVSFLYERSQQVDRLSRSDLLVVALAPSRDEPRWPLLTDFRPSVVKRMLATAESDIVRRIGLVQSWGRPRFVQIEPSPSTASRN